MVNHHSINKKNTNLSLLIASLGVVFGDIGTSPIYALKQCIDTKLIDIHNHASIIGICSLIIWSLFLIVTLKYIKIIFKADNYGEGGILSLMVLCINNNQSKKLKKIILWC